MNDETLTKHLSQLEKQIGKDRVQTLRLHAANKGISINKLLADAVTTYVDKITQPIAV